MSKEHATEIVRVKCRNTLNCGIEHTATIPAGENKGLYVKVECPGCKRLTMKKDLNILITYPKVLVP